MKMEEILTLDGVISLTKSLDDYLEKNPVWPASRLHRISEIAANIGQSNMVSQAEGVLTRYKEVEDMLGQRKGTLRRAEERLKVNTSIWTLVLWLLFNHNILYSKGHPSCEISSTNTGGSDESSSTPQDGDEESDPAPEDTDDEIDSPIPESVQAFISPERKISSEKLYTWKEVSGLQPDSPPVRMRSIHYVIVIFTLYVSAWLRTHIVWCQVTWFTLSFVFGFYVIVILVRVREGNLLRSIIYNQLTRSWHNVLI